MTAPAGRPPSPSRRGRTAARGAAAVLAATATLALTWCAITLAWGEPVTAAVHHAELRGLERQLDAQAASVRALPRSRPARVPAVADGTAVGRLAGRGVDAIVVMGRRPSDLRRGPGLWGGRPGHGRTTVISGHRTTYGAPFRHVDGLRRGDRLRLATPYGTFHYRVTGTRIVDPTDLSVTRDVGRERLVLTACHPAYSAAQRIVVFADRIGDAGTERRPSRSATFG